MKHVFIASSLAALLALSGCNDSKTTTETTSPTAALDAVTMVQRSANATENLQWSKDSSNIELYLIGPNKDKFEIVNYATKSELKFRDGFDATYKEGGVNEFYVEIKGRDLSQNINKTVGFYKIRIPKSATGGPVVTTDVQAPIIVSSITESVDTTLPLNHLVSDSSGLKEVIFSEAGPNYYFTIAGTSVITPATVGDYNLTVEATDLYNNTSKGVILVHVTEPSVESNTTTDTNSTTGLQWSAIANESSSWAEANQACQNMSPIGAWRLPTIDELEAHSDETLAALPEGRAKTSVVWSSNLAEKDPVSGVARYEGWGYYVSPPVSTAQLTTQSYFFTCVKP